MIDAIYTTVALLYLPCMMLCNHAITTAVLSVQCTWQWAWCGRSQF